MCVIIDANVLHEVFGDSPTKAGRDFVDWIDKRGGKLVAGKRLMNELDKASSKFKEWAKEASRSGRLQMAEQDKIAAAADTLHQGGLVGSDDVHTLALAQASGARLLYTHDAKLIEDFKKKPIIDDPRGRIYPTGSSKKSCDARRRLLQKKDLCGRRK